MIGHDRIMLCNHDCASQSLELVTIVTVFNVVIGGFSGEDLELLAHEKLLLKARNQECLPMMGF